MFEPFSRIPRDLASGPVHVVVLGASNVTLGFPRIVAEVQTLFPGPVQLFAAHGHGRSFGRTSRAFIRGLPGLIEAGLWTDLAHIREASGTAPPPLFALVTDLGNDLVFGSSPERIDGWLARCLERLQSLDARIIVGRPPLEPLRRVGRTRFLAFRSLFFPQSPLTFEAMQRDAPHLDELIVHRAGITGAALVSPRNEWYGIDPIHIRRSRREAAWREILSLWNVEPAGIQRRPSLRHWLLRPQERQFFRTTYRTPQPALRWPEGGAIWLY